MCIYIYTYSELSFDKKVASKLRKFDWYKKPWPLHPSRASAPLCNSITLHICTFVSSCRVSGHGFFCCPMMLFRFVSFRFVSLLAARLHGRAYVRTRTLLAVSRLMPEGSFLTAYGRVSCYKTFVIISVAIVLQNPRVLPN